jgi:hypothetical protein
LNGNVHLFTKVRSSSFQPSCIVFFAKSFICLMIS